MRRRKRRKGGEERVEGEEEMKGEREKEREEKEVNSLYPTSENAGSKPSCCHPTLCSCSQSR